MSLSETKEALLLERLDAFTGGQSSGVRNQAIVNRLRVFGQQVQTINRELAMRKVAARPAAPAAVVAPKKAKRRPILQPIKPPAIVIKPVGQQVFLPDPIDSVAARSDPMSIWTDLGGIIKGAVTQRVTQAVTPRPVITPGPIPAQASILGPAATVAGRVIPSLGRVLTGRAATAGAVGFAAGQLFDAAGNPVPKRRRMNFGNAKAARRAIRRIKGVRRLLKSIEDQLPRRPAPRRRAQHHHHPSAGG